MNPIPDRARELLRTVRSTDDADESGDDGRDESNDPARISRRRFLGATTALGVGSVAPGAAAASRSQGQHHIVLNSPSTPAEYQFAVSGGLRKTTSTGSVASASATLDPEDNIFYPDGFDGAAVRGATHGGLDAYVYTGQIVNFEAANCGSLNVWVNGSKQPACKLNRNYNMDVFGGGGGGGSGSDGGNSGSAGRYHLVLHNSSSVSQYEITVSRNAWKTADLGGLSSRSASIDAADSIDNPRGSEGRILRGSTSGEVDAYVYEGQIVEFDASNCGSLDVWVNEEYQPACTLNSEY